MARLIFITGGVVSSLGKGLASAALGALLQARGYRVRLRKLDPYLNVDPGTMSPFQHGEVYVTDDGAETDLDLGHYERFTGVPSSKSDNITSGRIYQQVIERERKGEYLGRTVQVIPHVTDMIKEFIMSGTEEVDFLLCEIGGTVGDIEGLPFFEAIRQLGNELGHERACFIHLTLLPYIETAGELKTKPTQHSVKELRGIGIQPDILLCRSHHPIPEDEKKKIALFTNVQANAVISVWDADSIYRIPWMLHQQMLDEIVCHKLGIIAKPAELKVWKKLVEALEHPQREITIAMVGKYVDLTDSYKSLNEALVHAGIHARSRVSIRYVDSETIENDGIGALLKGVDAILVPGGFGKRGVEGMMKAIQYARENKVPYLGICLGMQLAVIEFARNVVGLARATSTEFDRDTPHPVIALVTEWQDRDGRIERRDEKSDLGGTMRLGAQGAALEAGSLARKVYGADVINERHRHRYEVNNQYVQRLKDKGLRVSGLTQREQLCEMIELPSHPWL